MPDLQQLSFPILSFSKGHLATASDPARFCVATQTAIDRGYFDQLLIVDSTAQTYVVLGYEVVREPFWKRPRTPFGRGVRVTGLRLSHKGSWSFDETKARVIAAVEADADHWDAQDWQELVRVIGAAEDLRSLFRALSVP
jgi:hypothetical protein